MKWNSYDEYLDECSAKFANGFIQIYSARKFRKLSQEQKFEKATLFFSNYLRNNFDAKIRWAGARLLSDVYTEMFVDEPSCQTASIDLSGRYLSTYMTYYNLAKASGLDEEKLCEHTKNVIKFANENLSNKKVLQENFKLENLDKTLEQIAFGFDKEDEQLER